MERITATGKALSQVWWCGEKGWWNGGGVGWRCFFCCRYTQCIGFRLFKYILVCFTLYDLYLFLSIFPSLSLSLSSISLTLSFCQFIFRFSFYCLSVCLARTHALTCTQSRKAKSKAAPAAELATPALLAQYACVGSHTVAAAKASAASGMAG